jgi:hypothetical protein
MPFYLSFIEVWIVKLRPRHHPKTPSGLFQTPPEYVRFKLVAHFRRRAVNENKEFPQIMEDALNQYLGKPEQEVERSQVKRPKKINK